MLPSLPAFSSCVQLSNSDSAWCKTPWRRRVFSRGFQSQERLTVCVYCVGMGHQNNKICVYWSVAYAREYIIMYINMYIYIYILVILIYKFGRKVIRHQLRHSLTRSLAKSRISHGLLFLHAYSLTVQWTHVYPTKFCRAAAPNLRGWILV